MLFFRVCLNKPPYGLSTKICGGHSLRHVQTDGPPAKSRPHWVAQLSGYLSVFSISKDFVSDLLKKHQQNNYESI